MDKYTHLRSPLLTWNLAHKHIFIRADLNVPLRDGHIENDMRLQALRPTLDYIIERQGKITLATHIGRPHDKESELSTNHLKPWFLDNGYQNITLLENLRFDTRESSKNRSFAQELAKGMDYYINDAFASEHRSDTSLTILPQLFDAQHRGIGLLVEHELRMLKTIKYAAQKPFLLIMGGNKGMDKLPFVMHMLDKVSDIMLCPELIEPFLILQGHARNVAPQLVNLAHDILQKAEQNGVTIHLPIDYLTSTHGWQGPCIYKNAQTITPTDMIISCGPRTIEQWRPYITQAKTIFFNGPMGDLEYPQTTLELESVLRIVARSSALTVIGGGSSIAALKSFNLVHDVDFCSTGGGATLAYLSDQPLPGLDALIG